MSMAKITLTHNHRRSITSSLRVVENLIDEIEKELLYPADGNLVKITVDISEAEKERSLKTIIKTKQFIKQLAVKYGLSVQSSPISRFISAHKSSMWVILCDTTSSRLRGYGDFPPELSGEFDNDIDKLQELIHQI